MAHGQPSALITMESSSLALGIDLGATKIAAALVDEHGNLLATRQVPTDAGQGVKAVLGRIAGLVDELAGLSKENIRGVGIGSPGVVDSHQGTVRKAVNLGWEFVDLRGEIQRRLQHDLPVLVQKDANANALGEYFFGAARGIQDFVYLGIGSGLGAGVLAGGQLVRGAGWIAADLGHLSLDPQGAPCACGGRGCAETLISGPGLVNLLQQKLNDGEASSYLSVQGGWSTVEILAAARQGDSLARQALQEIGQGLGQVMACCAAVLDPACIVIGGGLGLAAFPELTLAASAELHRRTAAYRYAKLPILPSLLQSPALGAACLAWYDIR